MAQLSTAAAGDTTDDGWADLLGRRSLTADDLLAAADAAMYVAKRDRDA